MSAEMVDQQTWSTAGAVYAALHTTLLNACFAQKCQSDPCLPPRMIRHTLLSKPDEPETAQAVRGLFSARLSTQQMLLL